MKSVLLFFSLFAAISTCFFSAEGARLLVEAAKLQDVDVKDAIHPAGPVSASYNDDVDEWIRRPHDHPASWFHHGDHRSWFDHDDGYHDRWFDHGDCDRDHDHWLDHDDPNGCWYDHRNQDDHHDWFNRGDHDLYGHGLHVAANVLSREHQP